MKFFFLFLILLQHTLSGKFRLSYNLGSEWDGFTAAPTLFIPQQRAILLLKIWFVCCVVWLFTTKK
jgi:hypothetical protein